MEDREFAGSGPENGPEEEDGGQDVYPSMLNRLQAMFFDFWIIVAIVMLLFVNFFDMYEERLVGLKIILFLIILFIYDPIGAMTGGTIGYRTMGMKIRREDGISRISIAQAYKRSFVKFLLGMLTFFWIGSDPKRRALHDKVAGTVVLLSRK